MYGVPLTKVAFDNLLGIEHSDKVYQEYFQHFLDALSDRNNPKNSMHSEPRVDRNHFAFVAAAFPRKDKTKQDRLEEGIESNDDDYTEIYEQIKETAQKLKYAIRQDVLKLPNNDPTRMELKRYYANNLKDGCMPGWMKQIGTCISNNGGQRIADFVRNNPCAGIACIGVGCVAVQHAVGSDGCGWFSINFGSCHLACAAVVERAKILEFAVLLLKVVAHALKGVAHVVKHVL
jgi:hypothetical protein